MKDIISRILPECNKYVPLVVPILYSLIDFGLYAFCFCTYFFQPLIDSILQKRQKTKIDNKQFNKSNKEYETLLEEIQLLKQSKKNYQQQISWSNDRLKLAEWGKDVTPLDEYQKKLEEEWN